MDLFFESRSVTFRQLEACLCLLFRSDYVRVTLSSGSLLLDRIQLSHRCEEIYLRVFPVSENFRDPSKICCEVSLSAIFAYFRPESSIDNMSGSFRSCIITRAPQRSDGHKTLRKITHDRKMLNHLSWLIQVALVIWYSENIHTKQHLLHDASCSRKHL